MFGRLVPVNPIETDLFSCHTFYQAGRGSLVTPGKKQTTVLLIYTQALLLIMASEDQRPEALRAEIQLTEKQFTLKQTGKVVRSEQTDSELQ